MDSTPPPEPDSLERFAADLRALRLDADSPTLAKLQHETGISRTVLSEAFRGVQVPSVRTVDRIVQACGGDPVEWRRRRDVLGDAARPRAAGAAEPPASDLVDDPAGATHAPRLVRRTTAVWAAAGAFVVGALISWAATTAVAGQAINTERASAGPQIEVENGIDPALSPCLDDAKVAAADDRTHDTKLEIVWSDKCYAGWARINRYDALADGNSMTVSIYPETAPEGADRQTATEPGVQSAYTTLVVRPSPETRLCAVGSITVDGQSIDLGQPLCT